MKRIKFSGIGLVLVVFVLTIAQSAMAWDPNGTAICTDRDNQKNPEIVYDGEGGAIITWLLGGIHARKVDSSGVLQWEQAVDIFTGFTSMGASCNIITDGAGGAIITWYASTSTSKGLDIFAQRVDADGHLCWGGYTSTTPVVVCSATGNQSQPEIVSDGAGGAIITWEDDRVSTDNTDIYAQRVDTNGLMWESEVQICTAQNDQTLSLATIASDGANGAIITWYDKRSGDYDVYAQRVDGSGAVQWAPDGVAIYSAPGDQGAPGIAPSINIDGTTDGALIGWHDYRRVGKYWDWDNLYVRKVNLAGFLQWGGPVTLVAEDGVQNGQGIASDLAGGVIISWNDTRSGNSDIYAGRLDADGNIPEGTSWTANGVPICIASGDQIHQCPAGAISDGAGGAILTWRDRRNRKNDYDIYAQKVGFDGVVKWTTNGVLVCGASGVQENATMAGDGSEGAIITWQDMRDFRKTGVDIYAQHVDSEGSVVSALLAPPIFYAIKQNCKTMLLQNYPNSFNPDTWIPFTLEKPERMIISIYDAKGHLVKKMDLGMKDAGSYTGTEKAAYWDGKNESGEEVASGTYFYTMEAGAFRATKKMVILR